MHSEQLLISSSSLRVLRKPPSRTYRVERPHILDELYPCTGSNQERAFASLLVDVDAFLDLTESSEAVLYQPMLFEIAKKRNITVVYRRMPIWDCDLLHSTEYKREILDQIADSRYQNKRILVHCVYHNSGGCWLVEQGAGGKTVLRAQ
jgi:hypothetical protein